MRTIEDELTEALVKAGAVHENSVGEELFSKISWTRAARTDKGVGAVGNVVGLKMITEPEGIVDRINAILPPSIQILSESFIFYPSQMNAILI